MRVKTNEAEAKKIITFRTERLLPFKAAIDKKIETYGCK
jgi:hypothetical protein